MKLYEMNTIVRDDLKDHPELKAMRPHPVGIANSAVNQYEGTNIFQWWVQKRDAMWYQHGEPVCLLDA